MEMLAGPLSRRPRSTKLALNVSRPDKLRSPALSIWPLTVSAEQSAEFIAGESREVQS